MKNLLFLLLLYIVCPVDMQAQETVQSRDRVADIRQLYKEAHETMAYYDTLAQEGLPRHTMIIDNNYMASGAGGRQEVITFYYSNDFDENLSYDVFHTYFAVRKFNVAARDYYEEYLYDKNNDLRFCYMHCTDGSEARYYWTKGKLIKSQATGEDLFDADFYYHVGTGMLKAFNAVNNIEY